MSLQMKLANRMLGLVGFKKIWLSACDVNNLTSKKPMISVIQRGRASVPQSLHKLCDVRHELINRREVIFLTPKENASNNSLMFIHGGGYISDLDGLHWKAIEYLIKKTGVSMVIPIYKLAPESTLDDELPILVNIFNQMRETTTGKCFVAGDSAGGGLSISLVLQLKQQNLSQPNDVFLFYPFLDIRLNNPDISTKLQDSDPILSVAGTRWMGRLWAGERQSDDPQVSPILADLSGLPNLHIYQGTHDILYPDAKKFSQLAKNAGVACHYHEFADTIHGFVGLPSLLPEARQALDGVADVINQ